ncbi:MAG: RICIN domain-containing protein, partial [Pseudomonadota bacterium]
DYANGQWIVSARITGPENDGGRTCEAVIFVRFYKPKKPVCDLVLSPNTVEPLEKSTATLKCKYPVSTATIEGQTVTLSPSPTFTEEGSGTSIVVKSDEVQKPGEFQVISAVATRTGVGSSVVTANLFYKLPATPQCGILVADPNRVTLCSPQTTMKLDCLNRVDSVTKFKNGACSEESIPFIKGADGRTTASFPYIKQGKDLETIRVCVKNKHNPNLPYIAEGNLEANLDPPTCSLTASPQNTGSAIKLQSVFSGYCLDNTSLSPMSQFTQQDCSSSASFKIEPDPSMPGYVQIKNVASDQCLDIRSGSQENGAALQQYPCSANNLNQQFQLISLPAPNPPSSYQIIARVSGKSVDVVMGNSSSPLGASVQQWDYWGGDNQKWKVISPTLLKPGDKVDLTVSNVQGCFNSNEVKIRGVQVPLVNGSATIAYTKGVSSNDTLEATIGAPGEKLGTCSTSIQGATPPIAELKSTRTCIDFNETAQLTLSCTNATSAYIEGKKVLLEGNRATTSFTKNQCDDNTVVGVCNGPGGQAQASLNLPICAPVPQCTFEPEKAPCVGEPVNLVLNCTTPVTSAKIMDQPVTLVSGRASRSYTPSGPDPETVLASVENTICQKVDIRPTLNPTFCTCPYAIRAFPAAARNLDIPLIGGWVDTQITIEDGQSVGITATGTVQSNITPNGSSTACGTNCLESGFKLGALIGKIGETGTPFLVGTSKSNIGNDDGGDLFLAINQKSPVSNQKFTATILGEYRQATIKPANGLLNLLYDTQGGRQYTTIIKNVPGNATDWILSGWVSSNSFLKFSVPNTTTEGRIDINGALAGGLVSPSGTSCVGVGCSCRLDTSFNRGALIGKVGESGPPFFIGYGINIPVITGGNLYLSSNNTNCASSAGSQAFKVSVGVQPSTTTIYQKVVPGNVSWFDTQVDLASGAIVDFSATGTIDTNGAGWGGGITPSGSVLACGTACLVSNLRRFSLIGKIGATGTPFLVGQQKSNYGTGTGGRLYLSINDSYTSENTGAFTVTFYAKGQTDRFLNSLEDGLSFTDIITSNSSGEYRRDEYGNFDIEGIFLRHFDDSYNVIASQSTRLYRTPTVSGTATGNFLSRSCTDSSDIAAKQICMQIHETTTEYRADMANFGSWLGRYRNGNTFMEDCDAEESECFRYYLKWGADAYIFRVGPSDSPSCGIKRMFIRESGCFTKDTQIKMANGKEKKVSELLENEYVWNPHFQTGVRIKKIVKGPEKKSLYRVKTGNQEVIVTEDHPFLIHDGWIQARALKKGQELLGQGEARQVTDVTQLKYQGPEDVFNFELDTDEPLGHVIMANGIPTGDLTTQNQIKQGTGLISSKQLRDIWEALPKAFFH